MKTAIHLLAVAAILTAPNLSATQSGTEPTSPAAGTLQPSDGELSTEVQAYIARGDEQTSHSRFESAIRAYQQAVDVARREGHLASWTSWKLASAYYYNGNPVEAAAALDELANEAALVGDIAVEALAIYNSAWLNGKAGRKTETAARLTRLEGLLRSRYMPVAIRERLSALVRTSRAVVG